MTLGREGAGTKWGAIDKPGKIWSVVYRPVEQKEYSYSGGKTIGTWGKLGQKIGCTRTFQPRER